MHWLTIIQPLCTKQARQCLCTHRQSALCVQSMSAPVYYTIPWTRITSWAKYMPRHTPVKHGTPMDNTHPCVLAVFFKHKRSQQHLTASPRTQNSCNYTRKKTHRTVTIARPNLNWTNFSSLLKKGLNDNNHFNHKKSWKGQKTHWLLEKKHQTKVSCHTPRVCVV